MSASWLFTTLIAIAFLLYYLLHKCHQPGDHVCKTCESVKQRQLAKPVKTATDLRSPEDRQRRTQGTMTLAFDTTSDPGLNILDQLPKFYKNEQNLPLKSDMFRMYMQVSTEFAIDYLGSNEQHCRVTEDQAPGFLFNQLPDNMPAKPEKFSAILEDIYTHIIPGLIHQQHPRFLGHQSNACSYPDMLAEFLIASVGIAQSSWDSAPAFTELQMLMLNWLGKAIGLSDDFLFNLQAPEQSSGGGAFQSSASDAILTALLAARERKLKMLVPDKDPNHRQKRADHLHRLVVYANTEAHGAVERAARLAMVRLHVVETNIEFAMGREEMNNAIEKDLERGLIPFFIQATAGTHSVGYFDNLVEIGAVATKFGLWMHVDGSYGAGAMICPEFRHLWEGINGAHSLNLDAHRLLLASCPCSILWTRDQQEIRNAFTVQGARPPGNAQKDAMDFRHWGVSQSRPATALKLWMIFRLYGLYSMQDHVRRLVQLTHRLNDKLDGYDAVTVTTRNPLTLIAFRVVATPGDRGNKLTTALCEHINRSHELLVTHGRLQGNDIIRLSVSHERATEADVDRSWTVLKRLMDEFFASVAAEETAAADDQQQQRANNDNGNNGIYQLLGNGFGVDDDDVVASAARTVDSTEDNTANDNGTTTARSSSDANIAASSLPVQAF